MERKATASKKLEISFLNVLFCLLVIFAHVTANPISTLQKDSWQYAVVFFPWRSSVFVVQGFIFLSGLKLFINNKNGINYRKFYGSRFTKIVVPYLIWNIVYYAYFIREGYFSFSLADLLKYIMSGALAGPFYSIIIIVQFYALAPLWQKMIRKVDPILPLVFSAVITLFLGQNLSRIISLFNSDYVFQYSDRVFTTYLFCWIAGCYAGARYEEAKRMIKANKAFITAVFIIFAVADEILSYISISGIRYLPWLEDIHYCYCISAVLFFFTLFSVIAERKERACKLVLEIDKATYYIFLSHALVINIVNNAMRDMGVKSVSATYIIRIITVYPITIGLCILWNKSRVLWNKLRVFWNKPPAP
jgi:peptidoglycan/LPS O-acetylase OafA/YrhL